MFTSPMRLCLAIDRNIGNVNHSVALAINGDGHIPAKAHCSLCLTSTLIGDDCIMGQIKKEQSQFKTDSDHLLELLETKNMMTLT